MAAVDSFQGCFAGRRHVLALLAVLVYAAAASLHCWVLMLQPCLCSRQAACSPSAGQTRSSAHIRPWYCLLTVRKGSKPLLRALQTGLVTILSYIGSDFRIVPLMVQTGCLRALEPAASTLEGASSGAQQAKIIPVTSGSNWHFGMDKKRPRADATISTTAPSLLAA